METLMTYLRNTWYVAAWADEVGNTGMFHRTLLDEPILFYRKSDGTIVALQDRCPHRFIPLHLGTLKGDIVECCYHGLQFDCTGKCVLNPHGDSRIPGAAQIRSYEVAERYGMVWIWMGTERADPALIADYSMLDDPEFKKSKGMLHIKANYELMGENLLDLSHVAYLHEGLLGSREMSAALPTVREDGNRLHVDRWMSNVSVPSVLDMIYRQDSQRVDAWQNMRWDAPGCFLLNAGAHAPGAARESSGWYYGVHIVTPETSRTTHYFYAAARPVGGIEDPESNAKLAEMRRIAFEDQDKPIIEAQQAAIGESDFWSLNPVLLPIDAGPIRMRRRLEMMIKNEEKAEEARA
jgi:phenylpropionate dioxygenase-like ring-hydroxylating dioxygenase large terminal subunit